MIKQAVLLTILASVFTSVAAYSDTSTGQNPYDEGYPPWRHRTRNGVQVVDLGFPSRMQVLRLRSLTPQQRQGLEARWQPYVEKQRLLRKQLAALDVQLQTDPRNTTVMQNITDIQSQMTKLAYEAWTVAKPQLRPEQLQELRRMAVNSARRMSRNKPTQAAGQQAPSPSPRTGVNNYKW